MKKIVMICAGGLSTNWLVKRLKGYCQAHQIPLEIEAYGLADYLPAAYHADAILLGPQIAYYQNEIERKSGRKVETVSCNDYALANCEKIINLALEAVSGK